VIDVCLVLLVIFILLSIYAIFGTPAEHAAIAGGSAAGTPVPIEKPRRITFT